MSTSVEETPPLQTIRAEIHQALLDLEELAKNTLMEEVRTVLKEHSRHMEGEKRVELETVLTYFDEKNTAFQATLEDANHYFAPSHAAGTEYSDDAAATKVVEIRKVKEEIRERTVTLRYTAQTDKNFSRLDRTLSKYSSQ